MQVKRKGWPLITIKTSSAALPSLPRRVNIPCHCGVPACTPHSSGFRKPCIWRL